MGWLSGSTVAGSPSGPPPLRPGPHRWAIVDVETSGLYANSHRVLSVAALALDSSGHPEGQVVSLVDGQCDPGPVHLHGLTPERLAGAPTMSEVIPKLHELLEGRVLVAHNASFDYGFLAAEAARAGTSLPVKQRLCTLALSRRLGVDVPNHQLTTLAAHWGVPQQRSHDAHDDARVLAGVFAHSLDLAERLALSLPVVDCDGTLARPRQPYPARVVKTPCAWTNPGPLRLGEPLVQGMKVVVTGETRTPRDVLVRQLGAAGLDVTTSVSRLTSVLITNDPRSTSNKAERARATGTLVLDEATLLHLLADVRPGIPKAPSGPTAQTARPARSSGPRQAPPELTPGPMAGRRVLVLGGEHQQAAALRSEIAAQGGSPAVNLSANVTDIVLLAGGEQDPRLDRARQAGVRIHHGASSLGMGTSPLLEPQVAPEPASAGEAQATTAVLSRGSVIDLPPGDEWTVNVAWRADALADGAEVDLVAFMLDDTDRVGSDEDFVFFNAPLSETGAIALSVDGDSEQSIRIDLSLLEHASRIVVAAALTGTSTFGDLGAVAVSVDDAERLPAATATLDAGTTETTMIISEFYRRGDVWRLRAVGQGYDDGLAALATRYGVEVE